ASSPGLSRRSTSSWMPGTSPGITIERVCGPLRHRGRIGAGLGIGEHLLRKAQQHFAAQGLCAGLIPEIEGLVGIDLAVVKLAPLDAVVKREAIALGQETAHARARRQADAEALALFLDEEILIGCAAACDQRQQILALDAVEALHPSAREDRRRQVDRAGESIAALAP